MTVVLIGVGFFALCAAIGLVGAAIAPGGLRRNVAEALTVCVGGPALIFAGGAALGLVWVVIEFVGHAGGFDG